MKEWTWKKGGKGVAGEYTCNGFTVFSASSGWKVTRPDGYTYEAEFKQLASAKRFAERKMK